MKRLIGMTLCLLLATSLRASAAVTVGVDPTANWIGYMNVFNLPADGGGYQFGSPWGTAALDASFAGPTLTLTPNTSIATDPKVAPTDPYWWKADGTGNKQMDANFYVEDSTTLPGQELTFTGDVLENSLVAPYVSRAFIKDFNSDYSQLTSVYAPLVNGTFSITLQTAAAGHHIQYGFETEGPNASLANIASLGKVRITAAPAPVPEPSSLALLASGAIGLLARRRKAS